jgi:RNA polymerase primary sigma factor
MDERLEDLREIVAFARNKGYVNYDEINELLPADFTSTEDMDFLFQLLDEGGIDIAERKPHEEIPFLTQKGTTEGGLDYDPDLERTNDPVKMYLREMGQTPLLNREGEVRIAKNIERGKKMMIKALSRSRYAARMILDTGVEIKKDHEAARHYLSFYDDIDGSASSRGRWRGSPSG